MKGSELSKRSFIGGTAALSATTIGAVTVAAVQEGSVKSNMKE
jgi:predicted ABC-type sugar transport system permease subunit